MAAIILISIGTLGVIYSYFLYPLALLLLPDSLADESSRDNWAPLLSLIIAARNEQSRIRHKLEESLQLRDVYPNLEILVASDASTDQTDAIVSEFAEHGVSLVRPEARNGKEFAQRAAIDASSGDIILFSDVGTTIVPESIRRIVALFANDGVGAVSSTDKLVNQDGTVTGESLYIRYEMWLRELESRKGGIIGLSGSFFAARREVCELWDTDIPSDFAVAITSSQLGLSAISDRQVIGEYLDSRDPGHEFARKVRTMSRGMTALAKKRPVLNPTRFGRLSFMLWSHKILRWAVPWFALLYIAGATLATVNSLQYSLFLVPVVLLSLISSIGASFPATRRFSLIAAGYFFVQVNLAALVATLRFFSGKRVTTWVPTVR